MNLRVLAFAISALAAGSLPAAAQMRGAAPGGHFGGWNNTEFGGAFGAGRVFHPGAIPARPSHRSPLLLNGVPYFYFDEASTPSEPPAPQVILLQTAPSEAVQPAAEAKAEPLLIELQGDRYIQRRGSHASNDLQPDSSSQLLASHKIAPVASAPDLAPVVLIYPDGRRESIRDYTIVSGVIYARGNYWTDGYWNKQIHLAALNLPATLQANQASGIKFILPSSPNEVVTRP